MSISICFFIGLGERVNDGTNVSSCLPIPLLRNNLLSFHFLLTRMCYPTKEVPEKNPPISQAKSAKMPMGCECAVNCLPVWTKVDGNFCPKMAPIWTKFLGLWKFFQIGIFSTSPNTAATRELRRTIPFQHGFHNPCFNRSIWTKITWCWPVETAVNI